MTHHPDHDPLIQHRTCWVCYQKLSAAFAYLAPELRYADMALIVRRLRRALLEQVA